MRQQLTHLAQGVLLNILQTVSHSQQLGCQGILRSCRVFRFTFQQSHCLLNFCPHVTYQQSNGLFA